MGRDSIVLAAELVVTCLFVLWVHALRHRFGLGLFYALLGAEVEADLTLAQVEIELRKQAEKVRDETIMDLRRALSEVRTLRGLLPICSSCKRIRDDRGHGSIIERYITEHTEARLTHWICPDCQKKLYPE